MATVPPDPFPASPPDQPGQTPDEIVPPDGDTDTPAPVDDPDASGHSVSLPGEGNIEGNPDHR